MLSNSGFRRVGPVDRYAVILRQEFQYLDGERNERDEYRPGGGRKTAGKSGCDEGPASALVRCSPEVEDCICTSCMSTSMARTMATTALRIR